jgi:hypothetical protein
MDRQIRGRGHCEIIITFSDETQYTIPQYRVASVETLTKNDPLSRRFPEETATVTLVDFEEEWNPDAPNNIVQKFEQPATATLRFGIEAESGSVEWTSICRYFILESPTWSNSRAKINMVRRLCALSGTFYQFEPSTSTLKALADSVFSASEFGESKVYESLLSTYPIYLHQYIQVCSVRDALLTIASAARSCLLTSWNGFIYLTDRYLAHPVKNYIVIRSRDMMERSSAEKIPRIRNEVVAIMRNPQTNGNATTVLDYTGSEDPDGTQFLQFDSPILADTISYSKSENISGSTNRVYNTGLVSVSISRTDSSLPYRLVVDAITKQPKREDKTYVIDPDGTEDETFENNLVNTIHANEVAQYRGGYLKNTRTLYTINYRGDPTIEALDLIRIELPHEGVKTCIVLEASFKYEYGFSGTLIVRKLDEVAEAQTIVSAISDQAVSDEATSDEEE